MVTYVATYGRDPKIAQSVSAKLLPDIEVVHVCLDLPTALRELPPLFSGDLSITPSSGLGSNTSLPPSDRKIPTAVFFGGGFSDDEYHTITTTISAAAANPDNDIKFVKVQKRDVLAAGSFGPNPDTIARIFRKKLASHQTRKSNKSL
ncbi:hypothetical protein QBC46DRAFT_119533 [Diplogelasinospora grovesii]|uniref:Uncharacterized protein n=1 Tax=Diplogelasinospora grovesii TaxID=303347 RepID=A0AAN6S5L0_9PEZI|nr:hypothetical protein QBC46DRAFT_119533 [Diplogelasinospora grovesii]